MKILAEVSERARKFFFFSPSRTEFKTNIEEFWLETFWVERLLDQRSIFIKEKRKSEELNLSKNNNILII